MQKKLLAVIAICFTIVGCGGKEIISEQELSKSVEAEEQATALEISEKEVVDNTEKTEQSEENIDVSNNELNWEEEMYDPVVSDIEKTDYEVKDTIAYPAEEYGEIHTSGSEFYYKEDVMGYYYNMEEFYLNSDFLYTMNDTLKSFYDTYLQQYQETEDWYIEQGEQELPEGRVPYSELIFLGVQYVDLDYVSLLFNDVSYEGGAHPYSMFDAITLDRHSGKEVTAAEFLGESDEVILEKVSNLMGLSEVAGWEDIDFYLQGEKVVFFYRMPGYWDEVVMER